MLGHLLPSLSLNAHPRQNPAGQGYLLVQAVRNPATEGNRSAEWIKKSQNGSGIVLEGAP